MRPLHKIPVSAELNPFIATAVVKLFELIRDT